MPSELEDTNLKKLNKFERKFASDIRTLTDLQDRDRGSTG